MAMNIYYIDCDNESFFTDSEGNVIQHSFSKIPFRIQKIVLKQDKGFAKKIIEDAKKRHKECDFNPVNSSGDSRNKDEIKYKSFCGLLIEQLCYSLLTNYNTNPNITIELDDSFSAKNQIDIRIKKRWKNENSEEKSITKTVEIRSSFGYKPIEKTVSKDFDILGPYINDVKIKETYKDYYLRFIFALDYENNPDLVEKDGAKIDYGKSATNLLSKVYFDEDLNLKKDLIIYFIGGATKSMMLDESISYLAPMSSKTFNKNKKAFFRKIKAKNGLDCISILKLLLTANK